MELLTVKKNTKRRFIISLENTLLVTLSYGNVMEKEMPSHTIARLFDTAGYNEYSGSACTVTKSLPPGGDTMKVV